MSEAGSSTRRGKASGGTAGDGRSRRAAVKGERVRRGAGRATITKAVVPAAGRGTRLLPATRSQPKEMLPIGRKPTIQHVVEELAEAGLREVLLISGQGKRAIEDHLDRDSRAKGELWEKWMKLHFFHVRQSSPRGLADAISLAQPFVDEEPFVVALGDSVIVSPAKDHLLKRMVAAHLEFRPAATIAVETVPKEAVSRYGIVAPKGAPDDVFAIADIVEKPSPDKAPSNLSAAGRYILDPVVFDAIRRTKPGVGGELWLTDALRILLREGHSVRCVRLRDGEHRLDIGNFQSYFQAFLELALADPECGEAVREWTKGLLKHRGRGVGKEKGKR